MLVELGFIFCGLLLYVAIPSKWKEIFWVNLVILLPVMGWMLFSQITSGYTHNQLGLRTDDWLAGFVPTFSVFVFAIGCMAMYGGRNDQLTWNRNMVISVFLYPLWGAAQQFLFNAYLTVRLVELGVPSLMVALIVGVAFMLIHYPNRWLMPATFVLGFVGSLLFQHEPNIWLLGFLHGWLGIPYYYWVMGRDPIAEKFGEINITKVFQSLRHRILDTQLFYIFGFPFSFRIIYDPNALMTVLKKHKMSTDDVEKISFVQGKVDGILGTYNLQSGEIRIDVYEIAARMPFPHPKLLDAAITESLAHELRHSWQKKHCSWFRIKGDQFAMLLCFTFLGCSLLGYPFFRLWFAITPDSGFLVLPACVLFLILANYAFRIILKLSSLLAYRWCWSERDARAYARLASQDGHWDSVIKIQLEDFGPQIIADMNDR